MKETLFVKEFAAGKPQEHAALAAGYSEQTARKAAYQILRRPLVYTALTEALERQGLTLEKIVRPVIDAMDATKLEPHAEKQPSGKEAPVRLYKKVPDHRVRLEAHDRAVALLGGLPKINEAAPASHGLVVTITPPGQTNLRPHDGIQRQAGRPAGTKSNDRDVGDVDGAPQRRLNVNIVPPKEPSFPTLGLEDRRQRA